MITRRMLMASGAACVALPSLLAGALAAPADPDPVAIVKSIYNGTLKTVAKDRAPWLDARDRPATLSKSLVALWKQADDKVNPKGDEAGPIDFDVTNNSQGMDVKRSRSRSKTRARRARRSPRRSRPRANGNGSRRRTMSYITTSFAKTDAGRSTTCAAAMATRNGRCAAC